MKRFAFVLVVAALVLTGCTPGGPATDPAADRAALEAAGSQWAALFNAGDAASVAAIYGENASAYPPNMAPVTGRAAIQELWQSFIDTGATAELEFKEVGIDGDLAYRIGGYTLFDTDGTATDNGHFIEIWTRVNGDWVFQHDIWNSDRPLETPEAPESEEAVE